MISDETNKEIDKLMLREIVDTSEKMKNSFFAMRDELMLNFDKEKVVDMTAPLKFKVLDLDGKVRRYSERMKRSKRK